MLPAAKFDVVLWSLQAIHWLLIPILLTIHAFIWYSSGVSSGVTVYALKMVNTTFLLVFLLRYRPVTLLRWSLASVTSAGLALLVIGLAMPLAFLADTDPGYFVSDAIGWLCTLLYIGTIHYLLQRGHLSLESLFNLLSVATTIVCFGLLVAWFLTGGEKVSIPPDIHLGIATTITRWMTAQARNRPAQHLAVIIILSGVAASGIRMNYLVTALSVVGGLGWSMWYRPGPRKFLRAFVLASILGLVLLGFWEQVRDRFASSVTLTTEVNVEAGQVLEDRSAGQRFLEGVLIVDEVSQSPVALLLGKGFGATYANTGGLIPQYPARMHNAHSTLFVVLLRSGLIGVLIVFCVPFLALREALRRERDRHITGMGLLLTYVALMTDQYLYWSLSFGMAFAMWWYARRAPTPYVERPVHR